MVQAALRGEPGTIPGSAGPADRAGTPEYLGFRSIFIEVLKASCPFLVRPGYLVRPANLVGGQPRAGGWGKEKEGGDLLPPYPSQGSKKIHIF